MNESKNQKTVVLDEFLWGTDGHSYWIDLSEVELPEDEGLHIRLNPSENDRFAWVVKKGDQEHQSNNTYLNPEYAAQAATTYAVGLYK